MKKSNTPKEAGEESATKEHQSDQQADDDGGDKDAGGIGISDYAYYQLLMKGGRVTRGTVRKEEPQTPQLPVQKMSRTVSRVSKPRKESKPPGEKGRRGRSKKTDSQVPAATKEASLDELPDQTARMTKSASQLPPTIEKPVQRKTTVKKVRGPKKVPATQPEPGMIEQIPAPGMSQQIVPMPVTSTEPPARQEPANTSASIITQQPDSGRKRAPSPTGLEQAKLNRSLQIKEAYEQHFPHYQYVAGRRVLYGDGSALVVSLDDVRKVDYAKLTAKVQIIADSPPIPMPVRHLKYLGRPFICDLAAIDAEQLSDEVQDSLSSLTDGKLLLAQVVDNYERETADDWGLQFYALGWEDDQIRLSGPVQLRNQLTKSEDIQILQNNFQPSDDPETIARLKEKFDLLRDLKPFDEREKLAYKDGYLKQVRSFARDLEGRYAQFKGVAGTVIVTAANTQQVLLTRCTFDNHQGRRCKGVLLQSKVLEDGTQWLLFRHIQMKMPLPRKLEWVPLLTNQPSEFVQRAEVVEGQTQFPHAMSEIFRGFVSLDYLMQLDNRPKLGFKLRSRNLVMVSHEAHLKQMSHFGTGDVSMPEDARLICYHCGKSYLREDFEPHQVVAQRGEKKWRCPSCIRCSQCHSHAASELMLACRGCSQVVHLDCLHQRERESIPPHLIKLHEAILNETAANKSVAPKLEQFAKIAYRCKDCIRCLECGKTSAPKWSIDFNFCASCERSRGRASVCLTCYEVHDGQSPKQTCSQCQRWVHNKCDLALFGIEENESKQAFSCQQCRVAKRIRHQLALTEQLGNEDKRRSFFPSFWEEFPPEARAAYLKKVKQKAFSFDLINERVAAGHYLNHAQGGRQLRVDLYQMFINAKQQNKAGSAVHKDAVRLSSSCLTFFKQWEPLLDRLNRAARLETLWVRDVRSKPGWRYARLVPDTTFRPLSEAERLELAKVTEAGQYFIPEEHGANEIFTKPVAVAEDEKPKVGNKRRRADLDHSDATSHSAFGYLNRSVPSKKHKSPEDPKDHDISAPCELEMKPQQTFPGKMAEEPLESPAIFQRGDEIEEPKSKRQRLNDYVEPQPESLGRLDNEDEEMPVSAKGAEPAASQKAGLSFNPNMLAGGVKEKVRRRIVDHYRNEDDEHCYYTNPIRCSFDDPMLIFEEMCYLCGSFGSKQDFIMCKLCGESFHEYCLAENAKEMVGLDQSNWCCLNCKACEICGKATDEKHLYFCGACDRPYHSFCLNPPIKNFPENWKCDLCFLCKLCGATSYLSADDVAAGLSLQDVDTEASKSFSLCYQCSKDEGRKQSCSICLEKTKPEQNAALETLKCRECGNYSHLSCSRTDVAGLKDLFDEYVAQLQSQGKNEEASELLGLDMLGQLQTIYKCLDCIIAGRSINFLILESCKHYENISAITKKHKFVVDFCSAMLVQYFPPEYRENVPRIIKKFATDNQDFFRKDDIVCKWLDLMETTTVATSTHEATELTYPEAEVGQPLKRWTGYNPFEPSQMAADNDSLNHKLTAHTAAMVPGARNMYESIYRGDLNRHAMHQAGKLMTSQEIFETLYSTEEQQKQLESRLVDGLADDEALSGSDSEGGANFDELCVDYECKLAVRVKERFFAWFETFYEKTAAVFLGQQPQTSAISEVVEKFSQESMTQAVPDTFVQNCQTSLSCLLCKRKGEYTVTGRLIPYRLNMFVHTNCALWTQGVFEIDDGQLVNFYHQQAKLQSQKCGYCGELGATMVCSRNLKNCQKYCHFPCAYQTGRIRLTKNKEFVCEQCNKEDMTLALFPKDLYRKRRLHIIQNREIITQAEYEKEQEELKRGNESMSRTSRKSRDISISVQTKSPEVDQDKWKPFYQDLFNRVGNLTVLSLRHCANQLIDVVGKKEDASLATVDDYIKQCVSSDKISTMKTSLQDELTRNLDSHNDYAAIRIYWKFYGDKAMEIPAESAGEARYMERGYFLYLSKTQAIYEISQPDLRTILDHCATQIKTNPIVQNRIQTQLKELESPQLQAAETGPPVPQERFWKRVLHHFTRVNSNFCLQNIEFCFEKLFGLAKYPINVWNNLQITPADLRAAPHIQLQTLQNRSNFFIRAAVPILHSQSMQQAGYSYPYSLVEGLPGLQRNTSHDLKSLLTARQLTLGGVFQRMVKVNNMEKYDQDKIVNGFRASTSTMPAGISSGRRNRLGQFSLNGLSSRHMAYQQLQLASGLGRKVDIGKCIRILTDQKLDKASLNLHPVPKGGSGRDNEADSSEQPEHADIENIDTFMRRRASQLKKVDEHSKWLKKIVDQQVTDKQPEEQGSTNQTASKLVNQCNLPMAMQYREAMAKPRKVEVGPSKIHRIGLFACEDLKQNDIVIEYVGEIISNEVADEREEQYKQSGIGDCYMFRLDDEQIIDATFFGGKARYLNHSCDSNCGAKIITVDGSKHIVIRARKNVAAGTELTYNYNFDQEEDKLGCYCGAKGCQGILGA